jgi:hypothetical protein
MPDGSSHVVELSVKREKDTIVKDEEMNEVMDLFENETGGETPVSTIDTMEDDGIEDDEALAAIHTFSPN